MTNILLIGDTVRYTLDRTQVGRVCRYVGYKIMVDFGRRGKACLPDGVLEKLIPLYQIPRKMICRLAKETPAVGVRWGKRIVLSANQRVHFEKTTLFYVLITLVPEEAYRVSKKTLVVPE